MERKAKERLRTFIRFYSLVDLQLPVRPDADFTLVVFHLFGLDSLNVFPGVPFPVPVAVVNELHLVIRGPEIIEIHYPVMGDRLFFQNIFLGIH